MLIICIIIYYCWNNMDEIPTKYYEYYIGILYIVLLCNFHLPTFLIWYWISLHGLLYSCICYCCNCNGCGCESNVTTKASRTLADHKNKITNQMNGCGHTEIYILYICTVSVLSLQLLHTKLCMIVVQHSGIKITT